MASTPIPLAEIVRPTTVTIDIKEWAEKVDSTMHDPITVYEFSGGREFTEAQDDPYRD